MQLTVTVKNLGSLALNKILFVCIALGMLWGCKTDMDKNPTVTERTDVSVTDDHSYSNLKKIRTKHLVLDLDVNFKNKTIYGVARHQMENSGSTTAVFDIKGLVIQKVTVGKKGHEKETDFVIGKMDKDSVLGQPLIANIPEATEYINIYYQTTPQSDALAWVDSAYTSSKKHPFLYTQGEAILTRTWIPLQDSPSNRFTYEANVKVNPGLLALMSAQNPTKKNPKGAYHFVMNQPISSYLIALTVGDIAYHPYNSRCGIYAEKEVLNKAAEEFKDLPKMVLAAEKLYGPYQWEKYDVMIQHYSFPFGGMENPRLTFASPTLIAGDKSLVSVIAHELAHSWSGNLVTNSTWNDFWLNEGFTVYFEERIMESLYGKETSDMLAEIEFFELEKELKDIATGTNPEDSRLFLQLKDRDPDDGMTNVAYVKGAFFLKTLERKVGRKKFDAFLKQYFSAFQFKTVNTQKFEQFLKSELLDPNKIEFNTDEWIYLEGLPKNCVKIKTNKLVGMQALAENVGENPMLLAPQKMYKWVKIKGKKKKKKVAYFVQIKRQDHTVQEWQHFIRSLDADISIEDMHVIDQFLHFKNGGNCELMFEWYVLSIQRNDKSIRPALEKFLMSVGRRKYILPLYKELFKRESDKIWAEGVFNKAKFGYHFVSRKSIESALNAK